MPGKFIVSKTPKGFYHLCLQAANSKTILASQNYITLRSCRDGIAAVKKNASAPVEDQTLQEVEKKGYPKYVVDLDFDGQYRFCLLASNNQTIVFSEKVFASKSSCLNGIDSVVQTSNNAETDESAL